MRCQTLGLSRLVREQADHQAVGFAEQRAVGRCHGSGDENLAAVDIGDVATGCQWFFDRSDLAVVDVQVGGSGRANLRAGDHHPE